MIPPTTEIFPGGSTDEPWPKADGDRILEVEYLAGGAYAATDGEGEISIRVDGEDCEPIVVGHPGLQELTLHQRTERHALEIEPSSRIRVYSLQFVAGVP